MKGRFNSAAFKLLADVALVAPRALVRVELDDGSSFPLATLYSDMDGTAWADGNPFMADDEGRFSFCADGYETGYRITVTKDGTSHILRNVPIGDLMYLSVDTLGDYVEDFARILLEDGAVGAPSLAFQGDETHGLYRSSTVLRFAQGGSNRHEFGTSYLQILSASAQLILGGSGTQVNLALDAANVLAQRNAANAQSFRVYNTFTDAANYERGGFSWSTNILFVGTANAGTGAARGLALNSALGGSFGIGISSQNWNVSASGHLIAGADNTHDIGASGATRPRSMYWGTQALGPAGAVGTPAYSFAGEPDCGFYIGGTNQVNMALAGAASFGFTSTTLHIYGSGSSAAINFGSNSANDPQIQRDANHVLAQRNGANAQTQRVYNTFTDASNYERLALSWAGSVAHLLTQQAGTGTARALAIGTEGSAILDFRTNGTQRWQISATGHLLAQADNTYDIGASGATRPRTGYFGTSVVIAGVAAATKTGSDAALEFIPIAVSDETTALTTGTAKVTFRMPYAFTLSEVRASLTEQQASGSIFTVDINESIGSPSLPVTILSTKITIDNGEKSSKTAATQPVISDANLADDSEITIDIDQIGASGAKGLKVYLIGRKA